MNSSILFLHWTNRFWEVLNAPKPWHICNPSTRSIL